jgi:hypothetical protein
MRASLASSIVLTSSARAKTQSECARNAERAAGCTCKTSQRRLLTRFSTSRACRLLGMMNTMRWSSVSISVSVRHQDGLGRLAFTAHDGADAPALAGGPVSSMRRPPAGGFGVASI